MMQTHIAGDRTYQRYLTSAYGTYLSQPVMPLSLLNMIPLQALQLSRPMVLVAPDN
jgi:hypothetical protein